MADCTFTISANTTEVASSFAHTPTTTRFTGLMHSFSAYIEAERDLEHCGSWDPACDAWIRDAERARVRVLDGIAALRAAPTRRREDLPLRHYADLAQMLIESDSPEQFNTILALPDRFPHFFRCASDSPVARRVNLMVSAFRQHLHTLATLSDFTGMVEAGAVSTERDEPVTLLAPAA